jgi:hypothetical protein
MLAAAAAHARLTLATGTPSSSRDSVPITR